LEANKYLTLKKEQKMAFNLFAIIEKALYLHPHLRNNSETQRGK